MTELGPFSLASLYALLYDVSAWVLPLLLAITLHEAAHGWMAARFGDPTALKLGRVSLNPMRHIDRFGTVVLPGLLLLSNAPFLFGYARPVPVNFEKLEPPRLGMFMVALAGVGLNLILAIVSALALHLDALGITPEKASWLYMNLYRSININVVLALFNLLPLLPFDGGRAVYALLPKPLQRIYGKTERYGMILVFLALLIPALLDHYANTDFNIIGRVLGEPVLFVIEAIFALTGNAT